MSMPMLPGLGMAVPPVRPFLAGTEINVDMLPGAVPGRSRSVRDSETIHLTADLVRRMVGGQKIVGFGYNRQVPGPVLRVEKGSTIDVVFTNHTGMPSTIRWHGVRVDNFSDGTPSVTQDPVPDDSSYTYHVHFPDAGVFWYHPQVRADIQMDLGLSGLIVVSAPGESAPPNKFGKPIREETLILDDMLVDSQGVLPWGQDAPTHVLMGRFGNIMLVNGLSDYHISVRLGDRVRFLIANAANTRTFNVVFGGLPVKLIASDLSAFEHELMVNNLVIGPGERYIVDVQFDRAGEIEMTNTIQAIDHFRGLFYPHTDHLGTVSVSATEGRDADSSLVGRDTVSVGRSVGASEGTLPFNRLLDHPDVIRDIHSYRDAFDREPDHTIEIDLRVRDLPPAIIRSIEIDTLYRPPVEFNDSMPMMNWLSTGAQVTWVLRDVDTGEENMGIYWDFQQGDVVKIRIHNNPKTFHPMNHPLHMHGQRFLILDIDGVRNADLVWKDTTLIPVASTVDLLVDMSNVGEWVMHCHIAEHLHAGMMLSFGVWE